MQVCPVARLATVMWRPSIVSAATHMPSPLATNCKSLHSCAHKGHERTLSGALEPGSTHAPFLKPNATTTGRSGALCPSRARSALYCERQPAGVLGFTLALLGAHRGLGSRSFRGYQRIYDCQRTQRLAGMQTLKSTLLPYLTFKFCPVTLQGSQEFENSRPLKCALLAASRI